MSNFYHSIRSRIDSSEQEIQSLLKLQSTTGVVLPPDVVQIEADNQAQPLTLSQKQKLITDLFSDKYSDFLNDFHEISDECLTQKNLLALLENEYLMDGFNKLKDRIKRKCNESKTMVLNYMCSLDETKVLMFANAILLLDNGAWPRDLKALITSFKVICSEDKANSTIDNNKGFELLQTIFASKGKDCVNYSCIITLIAEGPGQWLTSKILLALTKNKILRDEFNKLCVPFCKPDTTCLNFVCQPENIDEILSRSFAVSFVNACGSHVSQRLWAYIFQFPAELQVKLLNYMLHKSIYLDKLTYVLAVLYICDDNFCSGRASLWKRTVFFESLLANERVFSLTDRLSDPAVVTRIEIYKNARTLLQAVGIDHSFVLIAKLSIELLVHIAALTGDYEVLDATESFSVANSALTVEQATIVGGVGNPRDDSMARFNPNELSRQLNALLFKEGEPLTIEYSPDPLQVLVSPWAHKQGDSPGLISRVIAR